MSKANKISIILIGLLLVPGLAIVIFNQTTKKASKYSENTLAEMGPVHFSGKYQIQIKLNPEKPKIGNNQLMFVIRDEKEQPVVDVQLLAFAEMPAMGSMQAMRETVSIENSGSGLFQGQYSLPMNGSWPLTVTLESNKLGKARIVFDMNTSRTGLKLTQATPSEMSEDSQPPIPDQQLATLTVDSYRRQLIGVTTTEVICQNLVKNIQTGARVTHAESGLTDITLKYDAWIGQLKADYQGKQIQQGEILFTVYSPDLVSAQDEYLASLKQQQSLGLRKAARRRLSIWGINARQINNLAKRGKASEYLAITSPISGTIIEKNIVSGSAVKAGARLLRLTDLSTVWVEGEVFESDLPWVKIGMDAHMTLPERPEQSYTAKVTFIDSVLNPISRSVAIRLELANPDGFLRPGMYTTLNLQVDLGERLVIPEQAVIYSGKQRIVFVDKGKGRLLPVKIKTGLVNEALIEVLDGLSIGDVIVTSGNFLIAAESKLKAGLAQW